MSSSYDYLSTAGRNYDLSRLEKLSHEWDLGISRRNIKNLIDVLYINLKFLDMFLSLQSFTTLCWDVKQKVQALFPYAAAEFERIISPDDVVSVFYNLEEQIWEAKLEIRAKYSFPEPKASLPLSYNIASPEFVKRFIDTVVINLSDLPEICNPYSWYPLVPFSSRQQMEEELKLLRNFVCFISDRCTDPQSQHTLFTHVLVVAGHAAMISWLNASFSDHKMRIQPIQPRIRKILIDVLQAPKSGWHPNIEADYKSDFVETLIHHLEELTITGKPNEIVAFKDQTAILQEMLNFLRANLINLPREFLKDFDTAIVDIGLLLYLLYESVGENEDMAVGKLYQVPVLDFSDNIKSIQAVIYLITRKSFHSNLPKIDGLGSIAIILDHLKEFLSRYSHSLSSIKSQLQTIQQQLEHFQKQDDGFKSFAMQVISKAYEVEHIIDSCISKDIPEWCLVRWTGDIIEEITLLMREVAEVHEKKVSDLVLHNTTDVASAHTSQFARTTSMSKEMVGFDEVVKKLMRKLTRGSSRLDVISIVGMPGLGKTTLASKLYHDQNVVSHFDVRAECCVSQAYTRKDLLLSILRDVKKDTTVSDKLLENELADKLRRLLLVKRYLSSLMMSGKLLPGMI
ncbi:hypothetical protein HAX54_033325 [Datura stramonium]|uniref:Uncharacterized protein n=1 Tax=Datura stramonium TaxID=4076 RepID=A0ABS8SDK2_DATST|nr:hypothetical protein [Datura stramonium]